MNLEIINSYPTSPSIADVYYDKSENTLGLVYHNHLNKIVLYYDVPQNIVSELSESTQPGVYVTLNIENNYKTETISKSSVIERTRE